ncbi:hypothetical protein IWW38_003381 [Coemansia aciculifera]|uniref:Uncharacterized protein n=1 Tax=Coemansia aciculifera TaxID=417176 RepID=A0ACC1M1W3_9FUNG|nr:hypothetical protein IWW38_003381 [Coemansia aciculifera]
MSDPTPIVVIMTGIGGSSYEYHIRCLAMTLANQPSGQESRVVVMNYRGASKTPLTTDKMYNAQDTSDYRDIVQKLKQSYPRAPLVGLGFSLGGNLLTRYMGEEGSSSPLAAGVTICCPFDMLAFALNIHRNAAFNDNVFQPTVASAFRRLASRNYNVLKASPIGYDMDSLVNVKNLFEFDSLTHTKTLNYKDCWEYYQNSSSVGLLGSIKTPYLAISTADDPVTRAESIPFHQFRDNPYTALALTKYGGHLGAFSGEEPKIWYLDPVAEFINGLLS